MGVVSSESWMIPQLQALLHSILPPKRLCLSPLKTLRKASIPLILRLVCKICQTSKMLLRSLFK